jgi:hypothetical protein
MEGGSGSGSGSARSGSGLGMGGRADGYSVVKLGQDRTGQYEEEEGGSSWRRRGGEPWCLGV